jgi:hypothetical protein
MKKLIYIFVIAAVVLASCKKNTTNEPAPVQQQEVEFNITSILPSGERVEGYDIPYCDDELEADYAEIWLDSGDPDNPTIMYADVYYIGDQLYTKALMMDPGSYTVVGFLVKDDLTGDGPSGDDPIYKAAPATNSEFYEFVTNGLDIDFDVEAFKKTKVLIDVLCFIPDEYELFGFFWFEITEITVREMCFFGDLCIKSPSEYDGSLYEESGGGVFIDEPAIFRIYGYHNGEPMRVDDEGDPAPYTNVDWLGVGDPLCIRYADYDNEEDSYSFELWVYVRVGSDFDYVHMYTWTWTDDFEDTYQVGDDGVAEFVVGNCNFSDTDFQIAPYMNLPQSATMTLGPDADLGNLGGYWDMKLSNFSPAGTYDVPENVWMQAWCGDEDTGIAGGLNNPHQVDVYSTLDPVAMFPTGHTLTDLRLQKLNYLFNHYYTENINVFAPANATQAYDIQHSIWGVIHSGDGLAPYQPAGMSSTALGLATEALQNGAGYSPLPGGNAGVLFFKEDPNQPGVYVAQLVLVVVDP